MYSIYVIEALRRSDRSLDFEWIHAALKTNLVKVRRRIHADMLHFYWKADERDIHALDVMNMLELGCGNIEKNPGCLVFPLRA